MTLKPASTDGLYPFSAEMLRTHAADRDLESSKGTIPFPSDEPLPLDLVATLVQARIAESMAGDN